MSQQGASRDVAIVGMSAMFANGPDLRTYWQSIIDRVDAVKEAPDSWAEPYYDPQSLDNDRIYTRMGGFLGDLAEFNPSEFGIMPNAVDGGEPDQYLALKMAQAALKDAGYLDRPFNREKTGIILGRGTYVNRGYTNLMQHGMMVDQTLALLQQLCPQLDKEDLGRLRTDLKSSLPPFTPEMSPGLVPNVVSGRIANRLDLRGPNFIVDAACASSLIAVELAIKELLSGRCEMVLAGGIHASTPPQIYMIFCRLAAMSRGKIRPFDRGAEGTLLGEGLGVLVLKRLADAERDDDRIYAVIKGVGTASDGKALGLLAPRLEGEVLALQRAYHENGIAPSTVELIEAHGTGIPLGDRTEISALSQVFGGRGDRLPSCALGSVKSMISHCIPAAGVAGIIKTALALYHKVLPPTLCDEVNPELQIESTPFYVNTQTRPWIHGATDHPRRAGVNAFGFGGINAHAVLEEHLGSRTREHKILHSRWPSELVVLTASDQTALARQATRVRRYLEIHPETALADLAFTLSQGEAAAERLAIVAKDIDDLIGKLDFALRKLAESGATRIQSRNGVYYGRSETPGKTAFLFPGEGAQYPNMLADLCVYFPQVRQWFDLLDRTFPERKNPPSAVLFAAPTSLTEQERELIERQLFDMDLGSEAVFVASMALYSLLREFSLVPEAMLGHSTGENAALIASGVVRLAGDEQLSAKMRELNAVYEELKHSDGIPRGALLTVGALAPEAVQEFLSASPLEICLAIDNCPNQVVLFGRPDDIDAASAALSARGGLCARLPFDRAYHTPLFEGVGSAFQPFYSGLDVGCAETPLYSCATMDVFPDQPEAIRALAARQWSSRVRFRETIERLYTEGFRTFVEAGPGGNLTSFVQDTLRDRDILALSSNTRRRSGLEHLQHTLARLHVRGVNLRLTPLYESRALSSLDLSALVSTASVSGALQPKSVLKLEMPRLHVRAETLKTLRKKLGDTRPSGSQASESGSGAALGHSSVGNVLPFRKGADDAVQMQGVTTDSARPAQHLVAPATASDPRLEALQGHFDLMQQFLAGQASVLRMFGVETAGVAPAESAPAGRVGSWPLLGDIVEQSTEELRARRRFDLQRDRFLQDHTLGGAPSARIPDLYALSVLPFTFSMEIIAEAAACLAGAGHSVVSMHRLRGYRWLTLDDGALTLDIHAVRQPPAAGASHTTVHVKVFQPAPGGPATGVLVFEGEVRLAPALLPAPPPLDINLSDGAPSVLDDGQLYATGMFHGPRLQGVKHIRRWSSQGIEAELETIALHDFFHGISDPAFLSDAGLLDAAGQLVGYWLTEQFGSDFNCFPYQVENFYQYLSSPPPGSRVLCRAAIEFVDERQIKADFDLLNAHGRVIARLEAWQDRHFKIPHAFYECRLHPQSAYLSQPWMEEETGLLCRRIEPFPEHFLEDSWAIWQRVLAHLMLNSNERALWYGLPEQGPRRTDWLLGRIAAKDAVRQWANRHHGLELAPADIEIRSTRLGKPRAYCTALGAIELPEISITHTRGYAIAAIAESNTQFGIDVERFEGVKTVDLLKGAFGEHELDGLSHLSETDQARRLIGLWCAKEAAAKAYGTGIQGAPMRWRISRVLKDGLGAEVECDGNIFGVDISYTCDEAFAVCRYRSEGKAA